MKQNTNHNNKYKLVISFGAFTISLSIFWSIISRVTNIFFLSKQERFVITGLIFLFALLVFRLFYLNKKIFRFISRIFQGKGFPFLLLSVVTAIFSTGLLLGNSIPMIRVPITHILIIQPLPSEENAKNVVYIDNIIEVFDAPDEGSINVDVSDIQITDGNYSITSNNEMILEEGAILTYTSFYSGCARIIFKTSPESGKVLIRFDNTEEIYSLKSEGRHQTEFNLCSRYPLGQLTDKWKLIYIAIFVLDNIFLTSLFVLIIIPLSYKIVNCFIRTFLKAVSKHPVEIIILSVFVIFQVNKIISFSRKEQPNGTPLDPYFESSLINIGDFIFSDFDTSLISIYMNQYQHLHGIIVDETAYNTCELKSKYYFYGMTALSIKNSPEQMDCSSFQQVIEKSSFTKFDFSQKRLGSCKEVWLSNEDLDVNKVFFAENDILYVIPQSLIDMEGMEK